MPYDRKALVDEEQHKTPASRPMSGNDEIEWDEVAQASWESFPASDPPSWIGSGSSHDPSNVL
jgi:hypothetical protein